MGLWRWGGRSLASFFGPEWSTTIAKEVDVWNPYGLLFRFWVGLVGRGRGKDWIFTRESPADVANSQPFPLDPTRVPTLRSDFVSSTKQGVLFNFIFLSSFCHLGCQTLIETCILVCAQNFPALRGKSSDAFGEKTKKIPALRGTSSEALAKKSKKKRPAAL